tara:strand:+ start:26788 stop:27357 length:570 start_codon:yes stop_codon:yes gene_type:complete
MTTYSIEINGRGGESVIGTITEEQYNFWVDQHEDATHNHLFNDPIQSDPDDETPNPVIDTEDPVYLGNWYELDDCTHVNACLLDHCQVTVQDDEGNMVWDSDEPDITSTDFVSTDDMEGFFFWGWSTEKGNFFSAEFDAEDFDPEKLRFYATKVNTDRFITKVIYDGQVLDNDGGDTIGKGYDYELIES